jgi:hypothetical protein
VTVVTEAQALIAEWAKQVGTGSGSDWVLPNLKSEIRNPKSEIE